MVILAWILNKVRGPLDSDNRYRAPDTSQSRSQPLLLLFDPFESVVRMRFLAYSGD